MIRLSMRGLLLAAALVIVIAGTVLATAPIQPVSSSFLSRGTVTERVHFNTGEVKFQNKASIDHVVQTITFGPGASSGWHSHPGVLMVSVTSGTLKHYFADCSFDTVLTGEAFIESGSHATLVRNDTASPAVVHVSYVVPTGLTNAQLREDRANPGCAGIN